MPFLGVLARFAGVVGMEGDAVGPSVPAVDLRLLFGLFPVGISVWR